jgi:hypothetical protein
MFIKRKEFIGMQNQLSQIRWGRTLWTTLTVYGSSFLIVFLIVTLYASYLAFQARGAPDQSMIQEFANQHASWIGTLTLILFTFLGAMWLARFVGATAELHGAVLGILVSLVDLIFAGVSAFGLATLITTVLVIVSGWLGGRFSANR